MTCQSQPSGELLRQGKIEQAVMDFEFAAEQGVPGAIWKLGRMYAEGDGVKWHAERPLSGECLRVARCDC